mgnify:CR=1 FL=1
MHGSRFDGAVSLPIKAYWRRNRSARQTARAEKDGKQDETLLDRSRLREVVRFVEHQHVVQRFACCWQPPRPRRQAPRRCGSPRRAEPSACRIPWLRSCPVRSTIGNRKDTASRFRIAGKLAAGDVSCWSPAKPRLPRKINSAPTGVKRPVATMTPFRCASIAGEPAVMDWALIVPRTARSHSLQDLQRARPSARQSAGSWRRRRAAIHICGPTASTPTRDVQLAASRRRPAGHAGAASPTRSGSHLLGLGDRRVREFRRQVPPKFFDPVRGGNCRTSRWSRCKSTIERDPRMIEAVVRGSAKGVALCADQPRLRPPSCNGSTTRPPSRRAREATLVKWDLNSPPPRSLAGMTPALEMGGGGQLWGKTTPEQFARLPDFLVQTGLIDKKHSQPSRLRGRPPGRFLPRTPAHADQEAIPRRRPSSAPRAE